MSIATTTDNGLCTLTIARPEKQNALTVAMYAALTDGLHAAAADPAVHAVLIAGQPGVFCAGNDLGDFLASVPTGTDAPPFQFMGAVLDLGKPLLAAVDGAAVGIGATLLLHCDLVFVTPRSRLMFPFVRLGVTPEFGSSVLLPRRLGLQQASRLLLLAEPVGAEEAVALGLANECLAPEALLPRAQAAAAQLAAMPAGAVPAAKRLMRGADDAELRAVIEAEGQAFVAQLAKPGTQAAMRAMLERGGKRG